jgi:hypothetical protein
MRMQSLLLSIGRVDLVNQRGVVGCVRAIVVGPESWDFE